MSLFDANAVKSLFVGLIAFGLSNNANSQIVHATFTWLGVNSFKVEGSFSFDNNPVFLNQVTESNGSLKNFTWAAFSNDLMIFNELVVTNYLIEPDNHFFAFDYDVSSNEIIFLDTGAANSWFTNHLRYPSYTFESVLQVNDQILSFNSTNASVSLDKNISAVPLPTALPLFMLGCAVIFRHKRFNLSHS